MQNQHYFLLSYLKYGDNDAVLHCFSAESGYRSFFVRGIYSPKNKKKPYLFPLSLLNISVSERSRKNTVSTISKMELASELYDLGNVKINAILFFVSDFLNQILREEHQCQSAFQEIQSFHKELIFRNNYDSYLSLIFKFLLISGIAPLFSEGKYLNPESGTFSEELSHSAFDEEISSMWKMFLTAPNVYEIRLKRNRRNAFADSLIHYYQIHFTSFHLPNSLSVLREIFE